MQTILDDKAMEAIKKSAGDSGGFQTLMKKLLNQLNGQILTYDEDDLEKLERYTKEYGVGGFENRCKTVLNCIKNRKR
ncbi:hypothetical protein [Campylobacter sp. CCUG 57310]|uniref:hypothetical protein n=1 Tax=Campylobacter sp. CCUG 57310 TaxID=2517362 RepID=UPI0015633D8D|nr:hypothetical protein [Campylobacter sp. CCUG 57310]QKF93099.1 hypothetical protein CORI_1946 [Campylobacter sp. CCUG 57310]